MTNITRMQLLRGDIKGDKKPFRPPWSIPEKYFVDYCTRCDKCIEVCFDDLIVKGRGGFPQMNFNQGGCDFCEDCLKVCETNALTKVPADSVVSTSQTSNKFNDREDSSESGSDLDSYLPPWHIKATIDLTACLSMNATVCRSCGESCEVEAIKFKLQLGGIAEPVLNIEQCTGCGACFSVCPVKVIQLKSLTG